MLKVRVIPCLLLMNDQLVKTVKFDNPAYIGDPINTVWIYNDMEVDEIIFLDITATREKRKPNLKILEEISNHCFMPLTYGGGIRDLDDMKKIFSIGIEKIAINNFTHENPGFIKKAADMFGSQSIVVSIDVKKNVWGRYETFTYGRNTNTKKNPVEWAVTVQEMGAGELLVTSIDRDGTWEGYDNELLKKITAQVDIPVIACGGAGCLNNFADCVNKSGVSAVAAGSIFVYQNKGMGVLIGYPERDQLDSLFSSIEHRS